jgi:hypothetical protein
LPHEAVGFDRMLWPRVDTVRSLRTVRVAG